MNTSSTSPTLDHSRQMDRIYRHQRHIYDLTRKYYLLGRDRLIAGLDMSRGQSLLEIGCGTGRNLALTARKYPDARLFGLDISSEMLATAHKNLNERSAAPVTLKLVDATALDPADFSEPGFDRIMISYALSMIPDWQRVIDRSIASLNSGGSLHIADFGQQERLPGWFRTMLVKWLARFHVTPRANLQAVLREAIKDKPCSLEFVSHRRGYAWIAVIRRDQA